MNLFGWGSKGFQVVSMTAGCKIGEGYFQCTIAEVSRKGLTCTFPTSRIQVSLIDMLDTTISISIDNMLMEGILSWYTIEESSYHIGITIHRKDRSAWLKVFARRCRSLMHTSARPASV
ncbi:MAG TPA: hypothetical protein VMU10_12750 [Desulfomonilia bacterium]|nr:hypothetical protein [Desulfomonilia bacterium]